VPFNRAAFVDVYFGARRKPALLKITSAFDGIASEIFRRFSDKTSERSEKRADLLLLRQPIRQMSGLHGGHMERPVSSFKNS
jgi:hypothetical protein